MKKKIIVYIYSYKNKNLFEDINKLVNSLSNINDVKIFLFDQSNINKEKTFNLLPHVEYRHIKWDDQRGKHYHRMGIINEDFDFYLELSDTIVLPKLWDILLLKYIKDADVVSGKNIKNLKINMFDIVKNEIKTEEISISNWIDFDLLIMPRNMTSYFKNIEFFKGDFTELLLSLIYFNNKKTIKSLPNNFYITKKIEHDYIPYSLYHKYNMFLDTVRSMDYADFENFHGIDFNDFKYMKYIMDDVNYHGATVNIDNLESTRFHSLLKELKIM